jgi:hypothetical protein
VAELRVPGRFRGPPGVANGGVTSGSLAALLGGVAEVTLRRPVPLDRPLPVRGDGDGTLVVEDGGVLLAEARPAKVPVPLAVPAAVTPQAAEAAAGRSRYYDDPVFPGCFVCGRARATRGWSPGRWRATAASSTPGRPCSAPRVRCWPPARPCGSWSRGVRWRRPPGRAHDREAARGGVDADGDPP